MEEPTTFTRQSASMPPRSQGRRPLISSGLSARRSESVELSPPLTTSMLGRALEWPWGRSTIRFLPQKVTRVADLPLLRFPRAVPRHHPLPQQLPHLHRQREAALLLRVPVQFRTGASAVAKVGLAVQLALHLTLARPQMVCLTTNSEVHF